LSDDWDASDYVSGDSAHAAAPPVTTEVPVETGHAPSPLTATEAAPAARAVSADQLRDHVLAELHGAAQSSTATLLETADWTLAGAELTLQLPRPQAVVEMLVGADARRIITAAASAATGRTLRL